MKAQCISRLKFVPAIMAVIAVISFPGCGDDTVSSTEEDANRLAAEGWNLFMSGDYNGAIGKFNEAVALNEFLATAFDGLGWCNLRLGNLAEAEESFIYDVLGRINEASPGTIAGAAIMYLAVKDYDFAERMSSRGLDMTSGEFQFRYDPTVTDETLRLIRAMANFNLGDYGSAAADVETLGGPPLNPNASDFVAKLLSAIQDLREEYGQGFLAS